MWLHFRWNIKSVGGQCNAKVSHLSQKLGFSENVAFCLEANTKISRRNIPKFIKRFFLEIFNLFSALF